MKKSIKDVARDLSLSQLLLLLLLIVPIVVISIYVFLFASDRYESTASVYITEEQAQNNPFDLSLLGITGTGSNRDILVLKAFIESQTLLDILNSDLQLLAHYKSGKADFISRLPQNIEREYALEYYHEMVQAELDEEAQLLNLSVQTFDAAYSKEVLEQILKQSQLFIDRLNENISKSQLEFFEAAVRKSEEELVNENKALQKFQQENRIFSTELATKSIGETISGLEQQLAIKQAELISRQGALGKNAPTLIRLKAEIEALKKQIELETERLAGSGGSSLSELDLAFRELKLRIEYKTLRYKANLEAWEQAQLDTARRLRFLTVVGAPTLPEASLYPNRGYIVITGAIIALMVYFIVSITIAVMREHA